MAGSTEKDSKGQLKVEVERVKNIFGNCKAIWDAGDFMCILTVTMQDVSIKLMINYDYPKTAPEVVIRGKSLDNSQCEELTNHLKTESDLVLMMNSAKEWLNSHIGEKEEAKPEAPKKHKKATKGKNKRKGKKGKDEDSDEGEATDKKTSMKTAMDVISRIQWDDALDQENFTVGYIDRFIGIIEKNFTAFSWADIASVDYNTLAIPKHRIEHFKYKKLIVWEKKNRLDHFFGSTGSNLTITDVINDYEDLLKKEEGKQSTEQESKKPQAAKKDDVLAACSDDDDDDDDFTIKVGGEYDAEAVKSHAASSAAAQADWEGSPKSADTALYPKEKYWGQKKRPTHFLCLRITDKTLTENVIKAHDEILSLVPEYHDAVLPATRLHITLACLGLDDAEQVAKAADILHRLRPDLLALKPADMTVTLNGVDNFYHSVLYAKVQCSKVFYDFVQKLRDMVKEHGIEIRDVFDFNPHMTLVKLKGVKKHELKTPYLDARLYNVLEKRDFGSQVVNNVWLCEMSESKQADGFYIAPSHIDF